MKIIQRTLLTLLLVSTLFIPNLFAEDYNQWHLPEGAKLRLGKGLLHDIKFTPDGNRIAVATDIGIWIYDAHTHKELALLTGHTERVNTIDFPADGRFLASGSFDGTVRLWNIDTGKQISVFVGHPGGIGAIAVSPDGKTIVSGDDWKGTLILWDTETGEQIKRHTVYADNLIRRLQISLDKSRTVRIPNAVTALAFSSDGKIFASGRILTTLAGHTSDVVALRFSDDGKTLASSSKDGTILLWNLDKTAQSEK